MANCIHCGRPAGLLTNVHPDCEQKAEGHPPVAHTAGGSAFLCNLAGAVLLLIGLNFLVFEPGLPSPDALVDSMAGIRAVNFKRLAMGQAFTVAGAIFLAAAWRPRR